MCDLKKGCCLLLFSLLNAGAWAQQQWQVAGDWCVQDTGSSHRRYMEWCSKADQYKAVIECQNDAHNQSAIAAVVAAGQATVNQYMESRKPTQCLSSGPSAPSASAMIPKITVTCVFKSGANNFAWYDGLALAFYDSAGHPNRQYLGKEVDFSPAPFKNFNGVLPGATALGTTRIRVQSASLCSNLISGHQSTLINASCPP